MQPLIRGMEFESVYSDGLLHTVDEPGTASLASDSPHDALFRTDVLLEVTSRLPSIADLAKAALVCRSWRAAVQHDLPWRQVYIRQFGEPHAWEACRSFREQCARRAGLRMPRRTQPLPGAPAPGAQLESYDSTFGIRTIAVSYDPVTRCLLRAVRSMALLGDDVRVAVQALPLGFAQTSGVDGTCTTPTTGVEASATAACGEDNQREVTEGKYGNGDGREQQGVGSSSTTAACASSRLVGPPTSGASGGRWAAPEPKTNRHGPGDIGARDPWVCMLSADGRPPPSPAPVVTVGPDDAGDVDGQHHHDDGQPPQQQSQQLPPPEPPEQEQALTAEAVRRLEALSELLPTVMCTGGGLLYLPGGTTGRGLAVWDLTARPQALLHAGAPAAAAVATAAAGSAGAKVPQQQRQDLQHPQHEWQQQQQGLPYWWLPEAHPARLLAACADGALAASACDGGRLRFWGGRDRVALGEADINHLTRLPVMPAFPQPAARPGAGRHRMRLALCEASGLAAVLLASPLTPTVYVYRAAPAPTAAVGRAGQSRTPRADQGADGGGSSGGVGQLLTSLTFGGAPGDGLALFRGHLLAMSVLCSDVMGARFGGSGGSSVLVSITVRVWKMPQSEGGEADASSGSAGCCVARPGAASGEWGHCVQLFSSRLQLEHPRTLVLGRMRPQLAATEDLLLLTVPRGVGGRPPHHQLLALELAFGGGARLMEDDEGVGEEEEGEKEEEEAKGRREGEGDVAMTLAPVLARGRAPARLPVVSEEERLPWTEVIEDADEVVVAVVPTPGYLALLSEEGRLRLYSILP